MLKLSHRKDYNYNNSSMWSVCLPQVYVLSNFSHLSYKLLFGLLNHHPCHFSSFLFSHSLIHATPNEQHFPLKRGYRSLQRRVTRGAPVFSRLLPHNVLPDLKNHCMQTSKCASQPSVLPGRSSNKNTCTCQDCRSEGWWRRTNPL